MFQNIKTSKLDYLLNIPKNVKVIHGQACGILEEEFVDKNWGFERIFVNTTLYCMKELWIRDQCHTSMHFHINKTESLYVAEGTLRVEYIDDSKKINYVDVQRGETFHIVPGFCHSLLAINGDVTLIEASTFSEDEDSIRIG